MDNSSQSDFLNELYHEKQEASLCAVHALNNLLQQPCYTAVELAEFAGRLDNQEQSLMLESGVHSSDYNKYMAEDSGNVREDGYFSISVITEALSVWNLKLISFESPNSEDIRQNPSAEQAFICNYADHWFTIRKFGDQHWINLNSLNNSVEYLSSSYLSLYLNQLRQEHYSVFAVRGPLPQCAADLLAESWNPKELQELQKLRNQQQNNESSGFNYNENDFETDDGDDQNDDAALAAALSQSVADSEEQELEKAIAASLENSSK
eukprot:gb/GECH01002596.1/.p1 GENE.gb/GECH01002596.1/~~gb/GECH01002596.1/.p1  ORF type:complete len:265 (+),score=93.79 gb/GECH01002596.1/:1-795(+)